MSKPRFIGPLLRGATRATSTGAGTSRRIPDDLLRQVSRRLEVMSLIAATRPDAGALGLALEEIRMEPWTQEDAAAWWRHAATPATVA